MEIADDVYDMLSNSLTETMHNLHSLYRTLKAAPQMAPGEVDQFAQRLQHFADQNLIPFVEMFKVR